jgi:hypothetical protein
VERTFAPFPGGRRAVTEPTSYGYQWKRDAEAISGATESTYTLAAADEGKELTVTVTAESSAGSTAATSAGTAAVAAAAAVGATPDFSDGFTSFDTSKWYPCYPYNLGGEVDEGSGTSWNAGSSPINGVVVDPFSVISDSTATDGKALRISCRPTTSAEQSSAGGKAWVGGIMISQLGWTGGYVEWRARFNGNGYGMWPALWLYAQTQNGTGQVKENNHPAAELDMFEVFGAANANPWNITVHEGSQDGPYSQTTDTVAWHTYGIEWNGSSVLKFYQDGNLVSDRSADAGYFDNVQMCARMNYTVMSSNTPAPLHFDLDYFHHYISRPT